MSGTARGIGSPFTASLLLHAGAAAVLGLALASGEALRPLPERLVVAVPPEIEAEPEPPREAPPLPEEVEPSEAVPLDEAVPEEVDPRDFSTPAPGEAVAAWDSREAFVGVGSGRLPRRAGALGRHRAPAAADPVPAPPPPPAPPEAPPGPEVRARPLPGACPAPAYPARERLLRREGTVRLLLSVLADGTVEEAGVETSSGSDPLDAAALEAVRRWRFEPARRGGRAVPDLVIQTIRFRIDHRLASMEGR